MYKLHRHRAPFMRAEVPSLDNTWRAENHRETRARFPHFLVDIHSRTPAADGLRTTGRFLREIPLSHLYWPIGTKCPAPGDIKHDEPEIAPWLSRADFTVFVTIDNKRRSYCAIKGRSSKFRSWLFLTSHLFLYRFRSVKDIYVSVCTFLRTIKVVKVSGTRTFVNMKFSFIF